MTAIQVMENVGSLFFFYTFLLPVLIDDDDDSQENFSSLTEKANIDSIRLASFLQRATQVVSFIIACCFSLDWKWKVSKRNYPKYDWTFSERDYAFIHPGKKCQVQHLIMHIKCAQLRIFVPSKMCTLTVVTSGVSTYFLYVLLGPESNATQF